MALRSWPVRPSFPTTCLVPFASSPWTISPWCETWWWILPISCASSGRSSPGSSARRRSRRRKGSTSRLLPSSTRTSSSACASTACCATPRARSTHSSRASSVPPPLRSPSVTTWTPGTRERRNARRSSPSTTASGSAPSWVSARRCAPSMSILPAPSSSTSSPARRTGSSRCSCRGERDERQAGLHPVPSSLVPPPRIGLVVASEAVLHRVCPARAHQRLRGLLRRRLSLAAPRPSPRARGLRTVSRPAEDALLPYPRYRCLSLCPLPCRHVVQPDPQGHGCAPAGKASTRLGHRQPELRGLARALGGRGLHAAARIDDATNHAALVALVQRRRDGRRASLPRPPLSDWPRLSPGMARGPRLRVSPPAPYAPRHTTLSVCAHFLAALPLGPSLQVHALRWAAAQASDGAHCHPVLRCRPPRHGLDRLRALDHPVAHGSDGYRRSRIMMEVE